MKKLLKKIYKWIDWILILLGSALIAYNFPIVTKTNIFECIGSTFLSVCVPMFYHYLLTAGVIIFVWGILIYKNKRE